MVIFPKICSRLFFAKSRKICTNSCKTSQFVPWRPEHWQQCIYFRPCYESKFQLKSNGSKLLPVNCKFICDSTTTLIDKTQTSGP